MNEYEGKIGKQGNREMKEMKETKIRIDSVPILCYKKVIAPTAAEKRLATSLAQSAPSLSRADCMTLACAQTRQLVLVMEEHRGRNLATAHNITYVTIQVLPLQGLIFKGLTFAECDDLLTRIGRAMRTDPAILTIMRAAATEIQRLRSARTKSPFGEEGP